MRHSEYSIPYGIGGTDRTVDEIEALVRRGAKDPEYIELARSILAVSRVPERDHMAEVHAIHNWVKANTRYTNDSTEAEVLTSPKSMMNFYRKTGMFIGDCDEFVTLEGILLRAVGHPTRFTVISQAGKDPMNRMGHIYHEVYVSNQWVPLDPIMKSKPVGYRPPLYTAIKTYKNGMGGVGMTWQDQKRALERQQHERRMKKFGPRYKKRLAREEKILANERRNINQGGGMGSIRINGIQRYSPTISAEQDYGAYSYTLSGPAGRRTAKVRAPKAQQRPRVAKARPVQKHKRGTFRLGSDPSDPKELFAKYAEKADRYKQRIPLIRSKGAQAALQAEFSPIYSQMASLTPPFATEGATAGANDLSKLNSWVNAVNSFSRHLLAAEKQYGTGAAVTAPQQAPAPTKTGGGGFLSNIPMPVLIGGGALALFMFMRR